MVRRSLIAVALFAVAAPLAAQSPVAQPEEWTWSSNRPDANAPAGVFGARVMEAGELEVSYRYYQTNWRGIFLRTDSLSNADVAAMYDDVPYSRRDIRHQARLAWGLSQNLTLLARAEFAVMERDLNANGGDIRVGTEDLGDVEVGVLYSVYAGGPFRVQLQGGAVIPTGKAVTYADTTRAQTGTETVLPYDMRPGGGTVGVILGASGTVQNEVGSLGAQFRLRTNVGDNIADGVDFKLGDQYEASGWAAYNLSSVLSVSGGIRWERWRPIEGSDPRLAANPLGDPHNAGPVLSGVRAHLPLGVNALMPDDSPLSGHRIGVEAVYTLHHNYDAPQLGMNWGFNFGYSVSF